jgi:hypothetical protein
VAFRHLPPEPPPPGPTPLRNRRRRGVDWLTVCVLSATSATRAGGDRKVAVRRRAAMLVPLSPCRTRDVSFIAAPLPTIVFGRAELPPSAGAA